MGNAAIIDIDLSKKTVLRDYRIALESREASLLGRKEVFMGKAKFGIFGDGKELPQIAMAKVFQDGDFRSGYYRDQTFMFAIEELTLQEYFAQLFAHTDVNAEPSSAGRSMNGHYSTRLLDEKGNWKALSQQKNVVADISPTAGQIPRLVGLGYASKLYRENPGLAHMTEFSTKGNEIAFGTIGNAATSEGMFFEAMNAAGVLQIPVLFSVWDDGYGISVPNEYHTTKGSISEILKGFQRNSKQKGIEIFTVNGWDYEALCKTYELASKICREEHVPVLVHVEEVTQPQGHSTSGSHERYKPKERLKWEAEHDCILKMREWILKKGDATAEELDKLESEAKKTAKEAKKNAWDAFMVEIIKEQKEALRLIDGIIQESKSGNDLMGLKNKLAASLNPTRLDTVRTVRKALRFVRNEDLVSKRQLIDWLIQLNEHNFDRYSSHLYSQSDQASIKVKPIAPIFTANSELVDGREVLQACFDSALKRDPRIFAFGEDVGKIGDVNQAFAGLQEKYGELRVTDTGIRECTIIGQGIGAAIRGLRPIAEIQYLDYIYYGLQIMADDLSCLQYRTKGGQKAPLIIRTRGHRLEGIWHTGSPIGMLLHSLRGIYILVPRNMTQAAGFYNTLFQSDDTALIIECLNGYRLKERVPDNIGDFTVPLGIPEIIQKGEDVTIVTYGSMCRIVMEAAADLDDVGISCEVIDVQTLLPFDTHHSILDSIKKTSRVIFADEDVPGGASAFMMQKVLEEQSAYQYLDSAPITIAAKEHRSAYASDGDYFSKPNSEDVFDKVYELMSEVDPRKFPNIY